MDKIKKKEIANKAEDQEGKRKLENEIYLGEKTSQNIFHFQLGYKSAEKKVKDKLNEIKSKLSEEEVFKLGKTLPNRRTEYYTAQKEVLEQVIKKL